jgi:hypothetical protein
MLEMFKTIDSEIRQSEFTEISKHKNGYQIHRLNDNSDVFAAINFQVGPTSKEVNGIFLEDLITICIDRLQEFQDGDLSCEENDITIMKLNEALLWLHKRYMMRKKRNVLGTNKA